jgi:hypothetical protein
METRTPDLRITNALLYQLSYTGVLTTLILASRRQKVNTIAAVNYGRGSPGRGGSR